jgi:DNA-binding response OmpR family regulator
MRRRSLHKNNVLTFRDITANLELMECRMQGKLLNLTRKETNLLLYFY